MKKFKHRINKRLSPPRPAPARRVPETVPPNGSTAPAFILQQPDYKKKTGEMHIPTSSITRVSKTAPPGCEMQVINETADGLPPARLRPHAHQRVQGSSRGGLPHLTAPSAHLRSRASRRQGRPPGVCPGPSPGVPARPGVCSHPPPTPGRGGSGIMLVLADKQNMVDNLVTRVNFKVSTVTPHGTWKQCKRVRIEGLGVRLQRYGTKCIQLELHFFLHIIPMKCSPSPSPVDINEMQVGYNICQVGTE